MVKGKAGYRHTEKFRCQETLLDKRMVEWFLATHLMAKSISITQGSPQTLLAVNQKLVAGLKSVFTV